MAEVNARSVALVEARWAKKPPVPLGAIAGVLGVAIFGAILLGVREVVGEATLREWADGPGRIGFLLSGLTVVGISFAIVRALFRGGIAVRFEADRVIIGDRSILYSTIDRIEYANSEATDGIGAGRSSKTTDAVLHVFAGAVKVRLIAAGTHVSDFFTAFDPVTRVNPEVIVVPLAMFATK